MRTYELALVLDPRLEDAEATGMIEETKQLLGSRGVEVVREEHWGKRKLAYPIRKLQEGRYSFLYLQTEAAGAAVLPEVELRLRQNERVLRYLTVRTDLDLQRARNRSRPGQPIRTLSITEPVVEGLDEGEGVGEDGE